jgi:galactokinase
MPRDGQRVNESPLQDAERHFRLAYGRSPRWIGSAPGRVNLIGEFTDFNGGFVLPMAIERRTTIAAAPNDSRRIVLRSEQDAQVVSVELDQPLRPGPQGSWGNYPLGVVAGFQQLGAALTGFDALVTSTVPLGAGLSSSAALAAATATVLEALCGVRLDPVRKAQLCQTAEHGYARVPCGIMDPFISILARAEQVLFLDCESGLPEWIALSDSSIAVLIVNTHVKHALASGAYAQRRAHCEAAARALGVSSLRRATLDALRDAAPALEEMGVRCARHVIGENVRTAAAAQYIREGRWEELGILMYASHDSLRKDYEVSCPELDQIVATAQKIGVAGGMFGCRLTGGGFGGCAVAIVRRAAVDAIGCGACWWWSSSPSRSPCSPAAASRFTACSSWPTWTSVSAPTTC